MTEEQYKDRLDAITATMSLYVLRRGALFRKKALTTDEWIQFLGSLWPEVVKARTEAAKVARAFYDSESKRVLDLPSYPADLKSSEFKRFVKAMEPARQNFQKDNATQSSSFNVAGLAVRDVQNAARGQMVQQLKNDEPLDNVVSLQDRNDPDKFSVDMAKFLEKAGRGETKPTEITSIDPADRIVRGWARVATGRETCEWCLMLVSRGPVYLTAKSAGSKLTDDTALRMDAAGEDTSEQINKWHPNCDCVIVPVFKISEWKDRDAWKNAEDAWISANKEAARLQDVDPVIHKTGKNKGTPFTLQQRTLQVLRNRLRRGEVSMKDIVGNTG